MTPRFGCALVLLCGVPQLASGLLLQMLNATIPIGKAKTKTLGLSLEYSVSGANAGDVDFQIVADVCQKAPKESGGFQLSCTLHEVDDVNVSSVVAIQAEFREGDTWSFQSGAEITGGMPGAPPVFPTASTNGTKQMLPPVRSEYPVCGGKCDLRLTTICPTSSDPQETHMVLSKIMAIPLNAGLPFLGVLNE